MTEPPSPAADSAADAGLTTGAVARRLGVAPTTLRSWDRRYGIGPAAHRGGRHRRWAAADVAVLERMCRLTSAGVPPAEAARTAREEHADLTAAQQPPAAPAVPVAPRRQPGARSALPLGQVRTECRGLARAAVRLDAQTLDDLLAAVITSDGLLVAWEEVIMPALHAVGRKYESSGERYVEVEHLLSWHVSSALRQHRPRPAPAADTQAALLACVPGESHTLPLEALAACLAEEGVAVRMFGAALPVEALEEAVRRTGPAAVMLWAQSRTTASRALAQHVGAIEWGVRGARTRPTVLLGGPGWAGPHLAGTYRPASLREALDRVLTLCRRPYAAELSG
ncbi:MerR family transcriptional regulator [Streptomyces sp. NPDC060194]|uniref:MerR family transcriptional regulator n=1 Tax=Streptomyces sp. NPDC060194 TaxID=3347069 RepID=UPI00365BDF04